MRLRRRSNSGLALLAVTVSLTASVTAGLVAGAPPAMAVSPDVVVSEVYGGGGNSGAAFTNDFIELFNASSSPVDVSTWSVQYASATGSTWAVTNLAGSIPAGRRYLVQEAMGAGGTTPLPTPDATGTIALSATAGKVALVTNRTALTGANPAGGATVRDLVGFGTANGFEGSGPAPAPSNTTSVNRSGTLTDTDNNAADFSTAAPSPQNSSSSTPAAQPIVPTCPSTVAATAGTAATAQVSATDADSRVTGVAVTSADGSGATVGGTTPASSNGGTLTSTLTIPASTPARSSAYHVVLTFSNDASPAQTATCTIAVTVSEPGQPGPLRIHDIQGNRLTSVRAGSTVTDVPGVVTGVRGNGFFLEDPTPDADPATSEGILVFTSTAPTVAAGDRVLVSGTVTEFSSAAGGLRQTEITGPTIRAGSGTTPLPTPVLLGPGGRTAPSIWYFNDTRSQAPVDIEGIDTTLDPGTRAADFYEALEGMRVSFDNATSTGFTRTQFGELFVLPGGDAPGTQRSARGGVIYSSYDMAHPQKLLIDDDIFRAGGSGLTMPVVNVGATLTGAGGGPLTGVLEYAFGQPRVQLSQQPVVTSNALARTVVPAALPTELSVASLNVENLDAQEPQSKFDGLAAEVVGALANPDILALQEIQDNDGATTASPTAADQTYAKLTAAIRAAGGRSYSVAQIDPQSNRDGGEPGGNIRVAVLYRTDRSDLAFAGGTPGDATTPVAVQPGPSLSLNPGRILDPARTSSDDGAFASSRKPLAAQFIVRGRPFFVVANHFNSKGGDAPLFGRMQPQPRSSEAQRINQAALVNGFVKQVLAQDADADVVVLGDLNDYSFSPALQRVEADGALVDLITTLPANEQYNYLFDGNSQTLDHTLVSPHLARTAGPRFAIARQNSEFVDQISDHEPEVVRLSPVAAGATPSPVIPEAPYAVLLVAAALALGTTALVRRRRVA